MSTSVPVRRLCSVSGSIYLMIIWFWEAIQLPPHCCHLWVGGKIPLTSQHCFECWDVFGCTFKLVTFKYTSNSSRSKRITSSRPRWAAQQDTCLKKTKVKVLRNLWALYNYKVMLSCLTSKLAQWVKALATRFDSLSLILRFHVVETENQPPQVVLWLPHMPWYAHTHTHVYTHIPQ